MVGSEHLFVGQDPEIFGKAIRLALAASPAQRAMLRHLARANSWDVRHQQLATLLANGLAAKGQRD